ncbi:MAG: hypothetical protein M3365_11770 [Gemmatimonadota bacterium]|nr:hypothetical protein [Gemmatimonadota bacterium]
MKLHVRACLLALFASAVTACGGDQPDDRANLTQREKDSILARSSIPGAKAVRRSMTSADSASARQARLDSAEQEP